ncbi:MAG: DUF3431 domain-containing protein [Chthoniobacter sp.]|nr:DUF3431 domain-containing protein [Chthoniobacter sp.]
MSNDAMLIVACHNKEDLTWITQQSDFEYVIYSKKPLSLAESAIDQTRIRSVENRGREALAYFKFMIDFYSDLPERVAFCHGHETAWHQDVKIMEAIRRYDGSEYFSLNNPYLRHSLYENCPHGQSVWLQLQKYCPIFGIQLPDKLEHTWSAQFITTRECILSNDVTLYRRCYTWLDEQKEMADFRAAILFEQLWYYILTGKMVEPRRLARTIMSENGYQE